jgi:transcriptional regulator with XRE-family HTH domain
MKSYFFTNQISNKFKSTSELPEWLTNYPAFKDQIKIIRETLGMTQEQLGKMVNRKARSVQNIESGNAMPKIKTLNEIANALNAELKIVLIPREYIRSYLDKKASKKAEQLIKLDQKSSALEIQSPSEEESKEQFERLKKEILEKRRYVLWNQNLPKK